MVDTGILQLDTGGYWRYWAFRLEGVFSSSYFLGALQKSTRKRYHREKFPKERGVLQVRLAELKAVCTPRMRTKRSRLAHAKLPVLVSEDAKHRPAPIATGSARSVFKLTCSFQTRDRSCLKLPLQLAVLHFSKSLLVQPLHVRLRLTCPSYCTVECSRSDSAVLV